MKIALTGGIACGKSAVAALLARAGFETLDADDVVHELIPDAEERRRIAREVFADPSKRRELEAKLHPLVQKRLETFKGIHIIPLLFECNWDVKYDIICTVRSDEELQIRRMIENRGYTRDEALGRLAAQMPVDEKARKSHYVINNNGSLEELEQAVNKFILWLSENHIIVDRN